nr:MAG TPA: hypothetical protein [Caudoviricetes sp.]
MLTSKYYPEALAEIYRYIENKDDRVEMAGINIGKHYNTDEDSVYTAISFDYFTRYWNIMISDEVTNNGNQLIDIKLTVDYNQERTLLASVVLYFSNEEDGGVEVLEKQQDLFSLIDELRRVYYYRLGDDDNGN